MISGAFAQKCASARLAQSHWTALFYDDCDYVTNWKFESKIMSANLQT